MLGNGLINYFSRSSDNWIVGKGLGTASAGFYSMAFQFARLPAQIVAGPLQYVLYSQLAKMKDDVPAIARTYLLATRLLATVVLPFMGMIAAAHGPIFAIMLSSKWENAGTIFMWLAPACAVQAVTAIGETVLYSLGRTEIALRNSFEYTLIWLTALLIAVTHGLEAAAITFTAITLLYQLRYLSRILPLIGYRFGDYFETFLVPLIGTGLGICAYQAVATAEPMADWMHVLLAGVIGLAVLMFSFLLLRHTLVDQLRHWGAPTQRSDSDIAAMDAGI